MRQVNEIIIHCSATRPEWMQGAPTQNKVDEIRRWHKQRGWSDIGYHILIDRDGTVMDGRPRERTGAHTKGHNKGAIGVCLIGGHGSAATDAIQEHFTGAQERALLQVIDNENIAAGKTLKVSGHNQYANKACPGFKVPKWYAANKPKPTQSIFQIIAAIFRGLK